MATACPCFSCLQLWSVLPSSLLLLLLVLIPLLLHFLSPIIVVDSPSRRTFAFRRELLPSNTQRILDACCAGSTPSTPPLSPLLAANEPLLDLLLRCRLGAAAALVASHNAPPEMLLPYLKWGAKRGDEEVGGLAVAPGGALMPEGGQRGAGKERGIQAPVVAAQGGDAPPSPRGG